MSTSRASRCLALLACSVVLAGGCGRSELTASEKYRVATAELAFATTTLNGGIEARTERGVDDVIALARRKPDAIYDARTMREVVADAASTLDPYRPLLVRKLERALRP